MLRRWGSFHPTTGEEMFFDSEIPSDMQQLIDRWRDITRTLKNCKKWKKNIAIVAGGDSSEIVISLKSADGIYSFIDKDKYNLYIAIVKRDEWAVILPSGEHTPIDKNDFSFKENGVTRHFDFAYITIHGTPGEDGRLQGYFDMIGMPYSSCGMLVSALTFNKYVCNHYLKDFGVKIAASIHLIQGRWTITDEEVVTRLGLPIFVKPTMG